MRARRGWADDQPPRSGRLLVLDDDGALRAAFLGDGDDQQTQLELLLIAPRR
jgi:hypothetical protein